MNIHVLCPFYRKHLVRTLIHYLEPMNIQWHPICDSIDIIPFNTIKKDWIHPLLCPPLNLKVDQCYKKFNDFIDRGDIVDDDYYCFTGDDDMFEPSFFDIIRQQTAKIIINSNYRGDKIPNDGGQPHETYPLILSRLDEIRLCNIGLGMFTIKGSILKKHRFNNRSPGDDGYFIEHLKNTYPNDIVFLSDWFVFGNYFQPGRHTDKTKFLKPNWELPIYLG